MTDRLTDPVDPPAAPIAGSGYPCAEAATIPPAPLTPPSAAACGAADLGGG